MTGSLTTALHEAVNTRRSRVCISCRNNCNVSVQRARKRTRERAEIRGDGEDDGVRRAQRGVVSHTVMKGSDFGTRGVDTPDPDFRSCSHSAELRPHTATVRDI
jgi:hypothetical protein